MLSTSATSTSSQYLRPDYLSPLPTTLDAKRSPLALLAQTCNSIGKDIAPCPQLNLRTSSVSFGPKDGGRSGAKDTPQKDQDTTKSEENPERSSSSTVEPGSGDDDQRTGQAPPPAGGPAGIPTTSSGDHHRFASLGHKKPSPREKCSSTPGEYHHHHHRHRRRLTLTPLRETKDAEQRAISPCKSASGESEGVKSSRRPKSALHPPPPPTTTSPSCASGEPSRLKTASCSPSFNGDCLGPIAASPGCLSSQYFTPHQHLLSSVDSLSRVQSLPGLSSYISYLQTLGREATSSCKDPFCTECPPTMSHLPGGLMEKCLSSTASHLGLSLPPYLGLPLHERSYTRGALDAPPGSVMVGTPLFPPSIPPSGPWHCPWVSSGGDYCNKRCCSAEELLVHTRTHWPSARMGIPPCFSLSPHGFHSLPGFLGYSPHCALGPSVGSMSLLRQAYGSHVTPHENGIFTYGSAATRFHPYKSPALSRGLSSPTSLFELCPIQRTMGAAAP